MLWDAHKRDGGGGYVDYFEWDAVCRAWQRERKKLGAGRQGLVVLPGASVE